MTHRRRTCDIYKRREGYFLFEVVWTQYGGVAVPPPLRLSPHATVADLSAAINQVLANTPVQTRNIDLGESARTYRACLKEMGFKTTGAFERGAALVAVDVHENGYKVTPFAVEKRGRGFVPLEREAVLRPNGTSMEEIAGAAIAALDTC